MSTRLKVILSALKLNSENKNSDIEMIRQELFMCSDHSTTFCLIKLSHKLMWF